MVTLPPPVIFTHNEILHAISLPPLADFLTSLSSPDKLVKLNDILDRFRTPKSYHRVDVRIVDSSDLPSPVEEDGLVLGEPLEAVDRVAEAEERERKAMRRKKERVSPVILTEGTTMEDYLGRQSNVPAPDEAAQSLTSDGDAPADLSTQPHIDMPSTGWNDVPVGPGPEPHDKINPSSLLDGASQSLLTPSARPPSPLPSHILPPSGSSRRVRELRLDLRSLDAAALFALETWRRETLGLARLDMELPDSVWYKGPNPSTPPLPVPTSQKRGKALGRPRKSQTRTETPDLTINDDLGGSTGDVTEKYGALMQALQENGTLTELAPDDALEEQTLLAALGAITSQDVQDTAQEGIQAFAIKPALPEAGPSSPFRSPSPDIILDDAFNEKEEADPDFHPPVEAEDEEEQESKRGRTRSRNSRIGDADSELTLEVTSLIGEAKQQGPKRGRGRPRKSQPRQDEAGPSTPIERKGTEARRHTSAELQVPVRPSVERTTAMEVEIPLKRTKGRVSFADMEATPSASHTWSEAVSYENDAPRSLRTSPTIDKGVDGSARLGSKRKGMVIDSVELPARSSRKSSTKSPERR